MTLRYIHRLNQMKTCNVFVCPSGHIIIVTVINIRTVKPSCKSCGYRNRSKRCRRPSSLHTASSALPASSGSPSAETTVHGSPDTSSEIERPSTSVSVVQQSDQIAALNHEVLTLKQEIHSLNMQLKHAQKFTYASIANQHDLVIQYTGLSNDAFDALNDISQNLQPFNYYLGWEVVCLDTADQILMTLMKLKRNYTHVDLGQRFSVSTETVKNVVLTWLCILHEILFVGVLKSVGIPSQIKNQSSLPNSFSSFSNCRIVIDCTEVQIAVPRDSMTKQNKTWSHYKQRNTFKGLIGVAPNACVTYASKLYPGSTSDKEIVRHCRILTDMQKGDLILADKGFVIQDITPPGVFVNVPPFLVKSQFTQQEVLCTKRIARARIHVERAIERIKSYHILNHIPAHYRPWATKIFQLCASLVNLQTPLIDEIRNSLD